jgi:hypothetical protein
MLGAALGLIVVGIGLTFFLPWVGPVVGAVGVVLLILYLVAFTRRSAADREPKPDPAAGREP